MLTAANISVEISGCPRQLLPLQGQA